MHDHRGRPSWRGAAADADTGGVDRWAFARCTFDAGRRGTAERPAVGIPGAGETDPPLCAVRGVAGRRVAEAADIAARLACELRSATGQAPHRAVALVVGNAAAPVALPLRRSFPLADA